jgi:hypothetical protein
LTTLFKKNKHENNSNLIRFGTCVIIRRYCFSTIWNNGYGGGGNGYGNGRNNQMSQMPQGPSHDQPKEIPVEVTVGKIMENFKSQLNLDALQEIAISNVLTDSMRSQGILLKAETGQEQKQKKLQLFQKPWTEKSIF